ncbi:MAG: hypothetical protein US25_C0032G0007 [Candidatus Moranbacteria bacterium GW2011_GWE1_36_7]|nr:MAG: hypothetical protein UR99_C0022G0009 [Candidatus Moranbacteria bacterium GW2011_GWD2_36_12]KKQ06314.1 MAG: hypothetical protein US16_C0019G0010 [Candidatus Moranbacteria bacterium GW2011_GWE2_36_40]KKQ13974.1 MAG: hypothetical protein US25_C0032G0007 [Candidatus Moranbacteria bacterium GW2011_GWE1_36_7]
MSKKIVLAVFVLTLFLFPKISLARENVTDWYIKDFDSQIVVNKDSSLDITEKITADCGFLPGKHGIFRILPTRLDIAGKKVSTPVELLSISNEKGQPYKYKTSKNAGDGTVTWQIGDAALTVQGVNVYVIHYKVQNAIRFDNQKFDEFYWNLNGNFWDLQADKFHATIKFPQEINAQNSAIDYYTGSIGSKSKDLATYRWSASNVLEFDSTKTILERQGVTASVTFPKNIFVPYSPNFRELYFELLYFLIPLGVLFLCYLLWRKYGDDPNFDKTVIAEYDVPGNLTPIEAGMLMKSGGFENEFITSEIIWFATKGLITIKENEKKILFFSNKDYELTQKHDPAVEGALNAAQQKILLAIFQSSATVALSSLKNKFYTNLPEIKKACKTSLKNKGLIQTTGLSISTIMKGLTPFLLWGAFVMAGSTSIFLGISIALSAASIFAFSFIMPKRTLAGAELNWKIKGFKLFMETVDKDRAAFYEKENIFEKCLPYAILFGMTKLWIQKMQEIYGADYYATHAPIWYAGSLSSFDTDSFASAMNNLSSDIASNTSAPSGAGGAGGSGGGGGGGGGGGW